MKAARLLFSIVVVFGAATYFLLRSDSGVVGYNGVRPSQFVGTLRPNDEVCQGLGTASRAPDMVRLTVGASGAGAQPLALRIKGHRDQRTVRRYRDGAVTLPLPVENPLPTAVLCVKNGGNKPVQLAGERGSGAVQNGRSRAFAISFTLLAPPRPWIKEAAKMLHRVGYAQGDLSGTFLVRLALTALLITLGLALAAVWRWSS